MAKDNMENGFYSLYIALCHPFSTFNMCFYHVRYKQNKNERKKKNNNECLKRTMNSLSKKKKEKGK